MNPARCPHCGKPMVAEYRPFCSKRCADVDLAKWLRGDYAIPGPEGEVGDDALDAGPRDPDQD
jgi:hypothetical protein